MKRPIESDYTSLVAYTRALEEYCDALSRVEQEPVAWMDADGNVSDNNDHKCFPIPLYTTPPQRKPLTLDELKALWNSQADQMNQWDELGIDEIVAFAQDAHGIKENT